MSLTTEEKKILARQICDDIYRYIETRIDNNKIPLTWDGNEIRELISELAQERAEGVFDCRRDRKRRQAYINTRMMEMF